jgi:cytochrome c oxidase assembly protein Cox11
MKKVKMELIIIFIVFFLDIISYFILNISIFKFFCNNININFFFLYLSQYNIEFISIDFILNNLIEINSYILFKEFISINHFNNINYIENINSFFYNNIYTVFFDSFVNNNDIIFYPIQKKLYVNINEPTLLFYRIINNSNNIYLSYSFYYLFPNEIILNFVKLQCFCMEDFIINIGESLDLPILFYIKPIKSINSFRLAYFLFIN